MRILDWLFGKKEKPIAATPVERAPAASGTEKTVPADNVKVQETVPSTPSANAVKIPEAAPPEAETLRRWRESGFARAWVEAHHGRWDHKDWLALLEELRLSPFWPMQPDAIGLVLEDERRQFKGTAQRH